MGVIIFSSQTPAPGQMEVPESEDPSPITSEEGHHAPSTQGSLNSAVVGGGQSSGIPYPSTTWDMPQP